MRPLVIALMIGMLFLPSAISAADCGVVSGATNGGTGYPDTWMKNTGPAAPETAQSSWVATDSSQMTVGQQDAVYTIKEGDTFYELAEAYKAQGVDISVADLQAANPGVDPTKLQIGSQINIPNTKTTQTPVTNAPGYAGTGGLSDEELAGFYPDTGPAAAQSSGVTFDPTTNALVDRNGKVVGFGVEGKFTDLDGNPINSQILWGSDSIALPPAVESPVLGDEVKIGDKTYRYYNDGLGNSGWTTDDASQPLSTADIKQMYMEHTPQYQVGQAEAGDSVWLGGKEYRKVEEADLVTSTKKTIWYDSDGVAHSDDQMRLIAHEYQTTPQAPYYFAFTDEGGSTSNFKLQDGKYYELTADGWEPMSESTGEQLIKLSEDVSGDSQSIEADAKRAEEMKLKRQQQNAMNRQMQQQMEQALWVMTNYLLGEFVFPMVDEMCEQDWEASEPADPAPTNAQASSFDPSTNNTKNGECAGLDRTIVTAEILENSGSILKYTYTITSCKEEISYNVWLQGTGANSYDLGSGDLKVTQTAARTGQVSNTGANVPTTDFKNICVQVSDTDVGMVCFPPLG